MKRLPEASALVALLSFTLFARAANCFCAFAFRLTTSPPKYRPPSSVTSKYATSTNPDSSDGAILSVKAADLDDSLNLSREERTVVNVHRYCKDSVVYVTSVLTSERRNRKPSNRWQRRGNKARGQEENENGDEFEKHSKQQKLPRGMALGSGSGFVIDSEGYIVTNYHVIQQAYQSNQAMNQYDAFFNNLSKNVTEGVKDIVAPLGVDSEMVANIVNDTVGIVSGRYSKTDGISNRRLPAQVFVRFGDGDTSSQSSSSASYHQCDIVDVVEELDIAVLKISNSLSSLKALSYGSSSDLLVGQSLLAIGNPFGLDRTLSQGVVSATGRSITGVAGNAIKNCIQTDAAINPGNSGGPLLDLSGEVVGVNTMIISTSGSNAGIGFAVPGDKVKEETSRIVELDKERQLRNSKRRGRGWLGVDVATSPSLEALFKKRLLMTNAKIGADGVGAFLVSIASDSPLLQNQTSDCRAIDTTSNINGIIQLGDRIVNVGGNPIADGREFVSEIKTRVEGEQLSLTLESANGIKRFVYVKLGKLPL